MTNRLSRWLLIAILLFAGAFWWLLIATDAGEAPAKPIHIAELRVLAGILPGQRPASVHATVLGSRMTWGDVYAAGIGLKRRPLDVVAWTLPVPGKGPVVIDPGGPPPEAGMGRFANFDPARQSLIDAQAQAASLVLYTQGQQRELPRAAYQLGKAGMSRSGPAPAGPHPITYTTAQAVAPGVVVIPASSHARDARLIYVQLADGREFLFAGAVAPLAENWMRLRARSHLATAWGPVQDRGETYAWLRTIRQLNSEAPAMKVVPGFDRLWFNEQLTAGAIAGPPDPVKPTPEKKPRVGARILH